MEKNRNKTFCIIGGGLAGTLMATFLAQRGIACDLFDKRLDMRKSEIAGRSSIVMSLSERGWSALRSVGLEEEIKNISIAKYARYVHHYDGTGSIQNYGRGKQAVYSINRKILNSILLNKAESTDFINIYFNYRFEDIDIEKNELTFFDVLNQRIEVKKYDHIISADGIFSKVRNKIADIKNLSIGLSKHEYVYKELIIPATENDNWAIPPNYIHIWPRKRCFFVAMPNFDKSFTCTLFYPSKGLPDVIIQNDEEEVLNFFKKNFSEVVPLVPHLAKEFLYKKVSDMYSVQTDAWHFKDKVLILGDAAHAVVPFYGMGMNIAFEDCKVLNDLIDEFNYDWERIFSEFYKRRKPETDCIAELSLNNLKNLEHSMDDDFDIKWKLERKIWELYPEKWMPVYTMVAFSHIPFSSITELSKKQSYIMDKLLKDQLIRDNFMYENFNDKLTFSVKPLIDELSYHHEYKSYSLNYTHL